MGEPHDLRKNLDSGEALRGRSYHHRSSRYRIVFGAFGADPQYHLGQEIPERQCGYRCGHTDRCDANGLSSVISFRMGRIARLSGPFLT